jgi:hypothetical protein
MQIITMAAKDQTNIGTLPATMACMRINDARRPAEPVQRRAPGHGPWPPAHREVGNRIDGASINQRRVLEERAYAVERLYAHEPDESVIVV